MASRFDISGYKSVLRVRSAYVFDIGGTLMRICQFATTIATISMFTMAGYSAFLSGTIASVLALALFIIAPRISKLVDTRGQRAVVPIASAISLVGLIVMIASVALRAPLPVSYLGAVLAGFMPSGPSLVRTRWTYLLESGRLGEHGPDLKSVYAYEGVIEDICFMIGPALTIALNTALSPIAGMIVLAAMLAVGTLLLVSSRSTEPSGEWRNTQASAAGDGATHQRSMFVTSPAVRVLFVTFLLMSGFYGVLNTAEVTFTEMLGQPTAASVALMGASIVSALAGLIWGTLRFNMTLRRIYLILGACLGISYISMCLITSIPALYAVSWTCIVFYAPFMITSNAMCQASVPKERLTESLTWMNAGNSCGMAIGPTLAGAIIDTLGIHAGFISGGIMAGILAVVVLASGRIWRRTGA